MQVEQLGRGDPAVAVVGAIHGDEPCGAEAVRRLIEERPVVERPVKLVVANEAALTESARYLDADLNRSFPGDPAAATHEGRLAARLADELVGCATLALHSTQSYEGPFALVDAVDDFSRDVCARLSVDAVVETGSDYDGRIFSAVDRAVEVECGLQRSRQAAENAYRLSREFLAACGALPDETLAPRADTPVYRLVGPIPKRAADSYEVYVDNFEEVAAGEVFAAMGEDEVVADEPFHPVLVSSNGYEDVFGYRAERLGTLGNV